MKMMKKYVSVILSVLTVFTCAVSVCPLQGFASTTDTCSYISYNKKLYDNNKELCDAIAEGIKNRETEISLKDFSLKNEDAAYIIKTVVRKHPEFFYVDTTKFMVGSDGTYIKAVHPFYLYDNTVIVEKFNLFNSRVEKYISKIDSSMSDFEKAVILHDELILNCRYYDEDSTKSITAYECLVNGKANCQGYAQAYSYLLSLVGVKSEIVESSSMFHMWNKVCIDGVYYNIDLTWDDSLIDKSGHVGHKYFLLSDEAISSGTDEISAHYGFDYAYYKSDNEKYDNYSFREFNTKFCFINGDCYVINNTYGSATEKCMLKYDYKTDTSVTMEKFDFKWMSGETSYWIGGYMSLDEYNGYLYYNSDDKIYIYDIESKSEELFGEVDTQDGDCYGLRIIDGCVYAVVSESPNIDSTLQLIGDCREDILLGDVNFDGSIKITDVTLIQKYAVGIESLTNEQLLRADFDGNTVINVKDATEIQKYLVNI